MRGIDLLLEPVGVAGRALPSEGILPPLETMFMPCLKLGVGVDLAFMLVS